VNNVSTLTENRIWLEVDYIFPYKMVCGVSFTGPYSCFCFGVAGLGSSKEPFIRALRLAALIGVAVFILRQSDERLRVWCPEMNEYISMLIYGGIFFCKRILCKSK